MIKGLTACLLLLSASVMGQTVSELQGNELFGGLKARHIGPALMSGRVSDIVGHPTDKKTIYIGTAGGGVWKSEDGGVHFRSIFDDYCQSIGTVAIDPNSPDNTIWVGTGEVWTRNSTSVGDGIYKSLDGGKNWKNMGLEKSEHISSIQIHPDNSDIIFVGVQGALWGENQERGVYKTIDGGTTWEKIFYIDENTGCSDLVMDPSNPSVLYASFWEHRRTAWSFSSGGASSALYKSIDGGKTWNKIHKGFPEGEYGRIAIAIAPSDSKILYSVVESADATKSGMYRSNDGGNSWEHTNSDFALTIRPFYFARIVVHPTNPDVIVKAGLFGSISKDGGNTFKGLGSMHPDIHDIWFDVKDPDKVFVGTDGGLYRSLNGAETMEQIENLPICQFYHVAVDNQEPYNIYGGLQDNGSWFGPSRSPGGVEARDWEVIGVGDGFRVYPHPTEPHIMYSEMQGAEQVWRYDNKARQLKVITPYPVEGDPKLRFNWNAPITTSPNNPDRLYAGSQFIHVSDDRGDTWRKISADLTTNDLAKQDQANSGGISVDNSGAENHCTIFSIAESKLDEKVIWAGTDDGNVQVTQDGGATWSNVTANVLTAGLPANTWCYHIEASSFDKGTAYAVFDGHTKNDPATYCYKTSDFGKTWKSITNESVTGFARAFQEDYENPNLLFLGTEFGLYISIDGGGNWMKFENNMPSTAIHYLEMQERTSDLVMGTHGRGIIIIDDISPLRQITNEVIGNDLAFLKVPSFTMDEESTFGGTSSETQFVGDNPRSGARICYYLAKRHTFGKMKMKVLDMDDNYVTTLSPSKTKGLNVVYWTYQTSAPKTASGKTFSQGGMFAPRAAAGKYKIVIEKGKDTYTTTIDIEYPKNSVFTLKERKFQEQTTRKLFDMNEELAYIVYQLDEWTKHAEKHAKSQPKLAKSGTKLAAELQAMKATLVITTGDNYVGRAENMLREDLGEIYSTLGSNFGPPTASQMENVKLIEGQMMDARNAWKTLQTGNLKKYIGMLPKLEVKEAEIETYDQYVKKD
ncbi:MAG: photosystem II stability/assembly factor-like uncharacterized protein [Crocinitomicaceae bacterium]|jgi:photosystem II stability/assembly factor-like uncharacterized protein